LRFKRCHELKEREPRTHTNESVAKPERLWSAVAERGGGTALAPNFCSRKRRGASLPAAVQDIAMIRVMLPYHLRTLARVDGEVQLEVESPVTLGTVLEALEARYPALRGTIRDHGTLKRRPFVRYFACKEDLSFEPPETRLPDEVLNGTEPFMIVGAMAGG
jgi:hypothetical protein